MSYFSRIRFGSAAIAVLAHAFVVMVAAQGTTGTVTWNGKPVAEARVTATALGKRVRSDSAGAWSFSGSSLAGAPAIRSGLPVPNGPIGSMPVFRDPAGGAWRRGDGRALGAWQSRAQAAPLPKSTAPALELRITARGYLPKTVTVTDGDQGVAVELERDYRRHMWVWAPEVLTNGIQRDSLFAFGARKGVGTFYTDAGGVLGGKDAQLAAFLDSAAARGFAVELLFGAPEWALTANHGQAVKLATQIKALAASQDQRLRAVPTSIQYDVEPYNMDEYAVDPNGVGSQWVDMYVKTAAELKGTGIGLTACVPRWLETRTVTRAGKARGLDRWLADIADRMTLMDYVDKAAGIKDGAAGELAYADSIGKEVVVGVETMPNLDPPSTSFAEEGEAALEAALGAVDPDFRKHPAYFGPAIHQWETYRALKP